MPRRRSAYEGANWRRSLALSLTVHAAVLAILGVVASHEDRAAQLPGGPLPSADSLDLATAVELAAADVVLPPSTAVPVDPVPPRVVAWAPPADRDNPLGSSLPQRPDGFDERQRPAPDRGTGAGRPLEDRAWRRDSSTLHDRLSDGADANQPSHARTAARASSPQAVRREPTTGIGDSLRDAQPRQPAPAPRYGVVDPDQAGIGQETRERPGEAEEVPARPDRAVPTDDRTVLASAQGPLDAERGPRAFDVDRSGFAAADDRAIRAASREAHPSLTELTSAAALGAGATGRGPADAPGAIARPSPGTAPAASGTRVVWVGPGDEPRGEARIYDRYIRRIQERVDQARVFPHQLKVQLMQGETRVRFVVYTDGHLGETVQVVKSSGFADFDRAALDAVQNASPFGPMTGIPHATPLVVNLLVTFPNPVIR